MLDSVQSAYAEISQTLVDNAPDGAWQSLSVTCVLTSTSSGNSKAEKLGADGLIGSFSCGLGAAQILNALFYLRDETRKTSGQLIWGLTFRLFADGKFESSYRYDKPESYDESDDRINIAEAVDRLIDMGVDVDQSNLSWRQKTTTP